MFNKSEVIEFMQCSNKSWKDFNFPSLQFLLPVVVVVIASSCYRISVETVFAPNLLPFLQAVVLASLYYRVCVEMVFVFVFFCLLLLLSSFVEQVLDNNSMRRVLRMIQTNHIR